MQLQIIQPSFWKRVFFVQTVDGKNLGTMKYSSDVFVSKVEVDSSEWNWIIKKKSFWSREIQVIDRNTEIIICAATYNQWKREMKCTIDYNNYTFRSKGFWKSVFTWENDRNEVLLEYNSKAGVKFNSTVTVADSAVKLKQLSLLTFMGLYQINAIRATRAAV